MKRIICLLLSIMLLCGCTAPATETVHETTTVPTAGNEGLSALCDGKTLKILAIGNSFSNNTTQYLYDVAAAEGITDITLGRLYIGGCPLDRHARNIKNDSMDYTYYRNTTGSWEKVENATLQYGLLDNDWDIITMQQSSGKSGRPDTYDVVLQELVDYVNANKTNPDAKLVWHMTWAYQGDSTHKDFTVYANNQDVMYKCIVDAYKQKVEPNEAFSGMIPAGTAVQNARTSYLGDSLTADGYHLNDIGKIIATYTWVASLTGKPLAEVHMDQIPGSILLDGNLKNVIIESVNNALKNPYQVTQSNYQD